MDCPYNIVYPLWGQELKHARNAALLASFSP